MRSTVNRKKTLRTNEDLNQQAPCMDSGLQVKQHHPKTAVVVSHASASLRFLDIHAHSGWDPVKRKTNARIAQLSADWQKLNHTRRARKMKRRSCLPRGTGPYSDEKLILNLADDGALAGNLGPRV